MSRFVRNTLIQFKLETAYGEDPGSWAAADALLVRNASFDNPQENVPRELLRGTMGGFEHINTGGRSTVSCEVEFSGSGTAGEAPAWGKLLRACGMAQVISAGSRVEYNPVSSGFESGAIRYSRDGVIYTILGVRGTVTVRLGAYGLPYLAFEFTGLNAAPEVASTPASDVTAFRKPLAITPQNGAEMIVGGSLASGEVTGGTVVVSQDLELMLGQRVEHVRLLNGESIDITGREASGRGTVFLPAADEVAWHAAMQASSLTTLGFNLGTAAGASVSVFASAMQRASVRPAEFQGRAMVAADMRLVPSAGNDELRIVAR